jgi:toxin ParE1/3/4
MHVLSPRAQADLGENRDHSLSRWGSDQAERYLRQIQAALELRAQNPRLGRSASAIRGGYRKQPCGAHVIFDRETATGIDVVRILHDAWTCRAISEPA